MTWYEKFIGSKEKLATILAKGHNICSDCQSDRKICNAEKNQNCAMQWLESDPKQDLYVSYQKPK
ncbi:hypothetical protein SAMN05446037_100148 [Anaerovirgula multivorans]|uniref:Uncharacterized protein n=1 Tax=Anaerovirgula multivorans TaxID=312168 RepID=A0A238ZQV9_9FIRM|nr:hypothetical protein [Anaerovirgula multivorans]SNR85755.1 hypothetical protein SAMN05446037_100148 [Anaerovirgula multivorans]